MPLSATVLVEHAARVDDESLSRRAQGNAATGAHQKALSEFFLQQGDLPAQARLREVERDRGSAEAAAVGDRHQGLELPELHSNQSYRL
jgi:hypothetical protein